MRLSRLKGLMTTWEYQFLSLDLSTPFDEMTGELNEAGDEGWEVISLLPLTWGQSAIERIVKPAAVLVLMKRPKPDRDSSSQAR